MRIDLGDHLVGALDKALNRSTPPDQVYQSASTVVGHLELAWDAWLAEHEG